MKKAILYLGGCSIAVMIFLCTKTSAQNASVALNIGDILGLRDELLVRPVRGTGYAPRRIAVINESGQIDAAAGRLEDCVRVDGTSGPCGGQTANPESAAPKQSSTQIWVDCETPAGAGPSFTLAHTPAPPETLRVFVNGLRMKRGIDYVSTDTFLQFLSGFSTPLDAGGICVDYSYSVQ